MLCLWTSSHIFRWDIGYAFCFMGYFIMGYLIRKHVKEEKNIRKYLGVALLPQAGVAIGMSQIVVEALPTEYGEKIRAVVLCATLVYELVGPLLTKFALTKAGEIVKKGTDMQASAGTELAGQTENISGN